MQVWESGRPVDEHRGVPTPKSYAHPSKEVWLWFCHPLPRLRMRTEAQRAHQGSFDKVKLHNNDTGAAKMTEYKLVVVGGEYSFIT